MLSFKRYLVLSGALTLALPLAFLSADTSGRAADHLDPPTRADPVSDATPDTPADLADIFAWHTATHLVVAVTSAGPAANNLPAFYDRDVLLLVNISNAGSRTDAEFPIRIRFGQNGSATGVQITGVPGAASAVISGPVETVLTSGGVTAMAGLFDDPFMFDPQGLRETRATGNLSFRNDRNFFANKNVTTVVMQIPRSAIENGSNPIDIWTITKRFGGQI